MQGQFPAFDTFSDPQPSINGKRRARRSEYQEKSQNAEESVAAVQNVVIARLNGLDAEENGDGAESRHEAGGEENGNNQEKPEKGENSRIGLGSSSKRFGCGPAAARCMVSIVMNREGRTT